MKRMPLHKLFVAIVAVAISFHAAGEGTVDPFKTDAVLRKDTGALVDPLDHDCAIPGGKLTFAAAVDFALCRNPQTRLAWAQARAQAAALGSAESAWLPSLNVTAGASRYYGQHADVNGDIVDTPQNTEDATANLAWTLYDFGGRTAKIRSARKLLEAAAATVSGTAQQLVRAVTQSYYGVVAGDAGLIAARITEDVTSHSVEIARALRTGGVGTLADVLQAETAHGQAVLGRIQAEATAKSAHGQFAVSLGLAADLGFTLDPEPVPAEVPALSARMADLMAEAAQQRPDLKAAQAQRDAAEANIDVARAQGRPSIQVGAIHSLADTTGVPSQNYNQIGLSFSWPLFTGFNVSYGVRQANANLKVQEATLEQTGLNITLDVWNAYYALESANQQLTVTASLTKTAEDNLQVALGRYQAGVGTIVDVLTAQAAASNARQLRINAELGWKVARAQLALALGRLPSAEPLQNGGALP
jgi:outer membrane protein